MLIRMQWDPRWLAPFACSGILGCLRLRMQWGVLGGLAPPTWDGAGGAELELPDPHALDVGEIKDAGAKGLGRARERCRVVRMRGLHMYCDLCVFNTVTNHPLFIIKPNATTSECRSGTGTSPGARAGGRWCRWIARSRNRIQRSRSTCPPGSKAQSGPTWGPSRSFSTRRIRSPRRRSISDPTAAASDRRARGRHLRIGGRRDPTVC